MTVQSMPGYVQGRAHTFGYGDPLPPQVVNLLQDDVAGLSAALTALGGRMFLPGVFTADYTMPVLAGPDSVGLTDNVDFLVGGVLFNTHDCASRVFAIPDWSTRYLRVEAAPDCGLVTVYETQPGVIADPLIRSVKAHFVLTAGDEGVDAPGQGGGATTKASMLLLKAVKGGPGSTPTITFYANKPGMGATSGDGGLTESDLGRRVATLDSRGRLIQTDGLVKEGEYWMLTPLTGPMTVNVSPEGNDATADGSPALPFKSVQAALLYISGNYSLGIYNVTIQIAAGTYPESFAFPEYVSSTGAITLAGAGPAATIIGGVPSYSTTSNVTLGLSARSTYTLKDLQVVASDNAIQGTSAPIVIAYGHVFFKGSITLTCPANVSNAIGLVINTNGTLQISADMTISMLNGTDQIAVQINGGSLLDTRTPDQPFVVNGSVTNTVVQVGPFSMYSRIPGLGGTPPAWTGNVTGPRYYVGALGSVYTGGGGSNFFPGTVAGTVAALGSFS